MSIPRPHRIKTGLALFAVFFIWGTTYLGIRVALEGFPPFLLNGIRFVIAGGILYLIARGRRQPHPTPRQWRGAIVTGVLMMAGGVGLVSTAEDMGVGSGLAATAVAVIPVWVALITGFLGLWPNRREWVGLGVGLAGVLVLVGEGDFRSTLVGTVLIILAPILWSIGTVWSTRVELANGSLMATSTQLLAGGVAMSIIGPATGERLIGAPTGASLIALGYLTVFGSIVAYTAYVFLLKTVRPALATSYAYVNPIVAVVAGVAFADEVLTGPVFLAMPLILAGVAMVTLGGRRVRGPEPVPEGLAMERAA